MTTAAPQNPAGGRSPRSVAAAASATRRSSRPPASSAIAPFILSNGMVDYYELMGVDDCASSVDIKLAYRTIAKVITVPPTEPQRQCRAAGGGDAIATAEYPAAAVLC